MTDTDRPTVTEVLADFIQGEVGNIDGDGFLLRAQAADAVHDIAEACADGPIIDPARGIIVHRADPELAAKILSLTEWFDLMDKVAELWGRNDLAVPVIQNDLRRAAAMLGGDPDRDDLTFRWADGTRSTPPTTTSEQELEVVKGMILNGAKYEDLYEWARGGNDD